MNIFVVLDYFEHHMKTIFGESFGCDSGMKLVHIGICGIQRCHYIHLYVYHNQNYLYLNHAMQHVSNDFIKTKKLYTTNRKSINLLLGTGKRNIMQHISNTHSLSICVQYNAVSIFTFNEGVSSCFLFCLCFVIMFQPDRVVFESLMRISTLYHL